MPLILLQTVPLVLLVLVVDSNVIVLMVMIVTLATVAALVNVKTVSEEKIAKIIVLLGKLVKMESTALIALVS